MSRPASRFTVLAASVLVPFAAGCSRTDRPSASAGDGTTGSTTVSTDAATPSSSTTTPSTTSTGNPKPFVIGTVVPSYADAERAFHRGRYEEAVSMFAAYSESEPDNAWGHYMLGLSAWKTGDHTRALEAFDAALRLEPTHRKSLLNSARVLLETSRPKDALNRIEQALAIEPLSGEGLRLMGRAHDELGEIDEAIDAYQRALALDDKDVWAMNNLGYLYIQQGRSDAALLPLARAVEIRGNVPVFQNNFGTALERSGHILAAREAYGKALEADSTYAKAAVGLERVTTQGAASDTAAVDVPALAREFQAEIEQWRTRPVTGDSIAKPGDSTGRVDSVDSSTAAGSSSQAGDSTQMTRDSVAE
jgi:predicted Zn-dependent protease